MKNLDDVARGSVGDISRNIPGPEQDENFALIKAILTIIFLVLSEPIYCCYRIEIGKNHISLWRLIAAFISFIIISSIFLYLFFNTENLNSDFGSKYSYLVASITLPIMAIIFLGVGIAYYLVAEHSDIDPDSRGLRILVELGREDGRSRWYGQYVEIIAPISFGVALCFYNLWFGAFIILCGISYIGRMVIEKFYLNNPIQKEINAHSTNRDSEEISEGVR